MKLLNGADQAFDRQMFKLTVDVNSGKTDIILRYFCGKSSPLFGTTWICDVIEGIF